MSSNYTVKWGDNLYHIARAHGVTLGELLIANPQFAKRDPNLIAIGETIVIPDTPAFCDSLDLETATMKCPKKDIGILSESAAQKLFDLLDKESHIPFDYPPDCCYSRAHEMCRIMAQNGVECNKYWLYAKNFRTADQIDLIPKDKDGNAISFPNRKGNSRPIGWDYHVAPLIKVTKEDGSVEERVVDPSLASQPVSKDEWKAIMEGSKGAMTRTP